MNGKESWVGTPQRGHETETPRRCSAFRITEGGVIEHFRVDGVGGLLNAAEYVQSYQQEKGAFAEKMHGREQISAGTFDQMALSRFTSTGQDTEIFDINCDKGEFSAVRFLSGWVTYRMSDVSAVLRYLDRSDLYDWGKRQVRLNVCANYDIASGQVCNELEISLHHSDGSEEYLSYALDPTEKELLRRKMDAYCQQQTGLSMEDYSVQMMEEEMSGPSGPVM